MNIYRRFFSARFITPGRLSFLILLLALFPALPVQAASTLLPGHTPTNLQDTITAASSGDIVIYSGSDPGTTFQLNQAAVNVTKANLTLQGGGANGFAPGISGLASSIIAQVSAGKQGSAADLSAQASSLTNAYWTGSASGIAGLATIQDASGGDRSASAQDYYFNNNKWLSTAATNANGLNLQGLHFNQALVQYSNTRIVNGLIGNINTATGNTYLGDIRGNAFTNLHVALHGQVDTQYLAGGGILGVRSTAGTAAIGDIRGNIFSNLSVRTDQVSGTGSAYLEGGGIIGVDGVSSPDNIAGKASLSNLTNNLCTGISVYSGDILLGGGLVGVNNNSKFNDTNPLDFNNTTTASLLAAEGNVFGNGATGSSATDYDIYVHTHASIRGGGVIGINGLSSAGALLGSLRGNVFNGVSVSTDSYLQGGGLVGLRANSTADADGTDLTNKIGPPGPDNSGQGSTTDQDKFTGINVAQLERNMVIAHTVSGNLFLNSQVSTGTSISGGGIIGLRGNAGWVNMDTLTGNIFKGLSVTSASDVSSSGISLSGGGIVGLSSEENASLNQVSNNYFDHLEVKAGTTNGELHGGGIVGLQVGSAANGLALLGSVSNNTFNALDVQASNGLLGGGIVGVRNGSASASTSAINSLTGNRFSALGVSGGDISGGGIVGIQARTGSAIIGSLADNDFYPGTTVVSGDIKGGGVVGINTEDAVGGSGYINDLTGNTFFNLGVSATSIEGGGIVGISSTHSAIIADITGSSRSSAIFAANTVTATGDIDGG
ncbi:MAG: hypothetical protein LBM64_06260, partial [Deltaproteobacteria bacterium]|nr:hypothetical protein [Deltaproteobacteria bacterium]